MKFKKWTNPYILRISSKPDYLINQAGGEFTQEDIKLLRRRMANARSVYIEIGSGSGGHLLEVAKRNPEALFIGIELRFKRAFRTAEKAEKQNLKNILVLRGDARLLSDLIPTEGIDGFYVNFPDPWNKKRWLKHRLLSPDFIHTLGTLLQPGGFISYKTDHQNYFDSTVGIFRSSEVFTLHTVTHDLYESELAQDAVSTEFESLFRSQKLPICYLKALRVR